MSSAICFNLDQSKFFSPGNGLSVGLGIMLVMDRKINFNPVTNKPWFVCVCSTSLLKTLWEKEKLLVMSIFTFATVFSLCHFHQI